jgi:hypothetical protein
VVKDDVGIMLEAEDDLDRQSQGMLLLLHLPPIAYMIEDVAAASHVPLYGGSGVPGLFIVSSRAKKGRLTLTPDPIQPSRKSSHTRAHKVRQAKYTA